MLEKQEKYNQVVEVASKRWRIIASLEYSDQARCYFIDLEQLLKLGDLKGASALNALEELKSWWF